MGSIILSFKRDSSEEKKMSRKSFTFVLICLTALFTSGLALKCMACTDLSIPCEENQNGTSIECPSGQVCARLECAFPGVGNTTNKGCAPPLDSGNACAEREMGDATCLACTCETENCNWDTINYATKAQISTITITAVIFLYILS